MTRSELVRLLARECRVSQEEASDFVEVCVGEMTAALTKGQRIEIRGFGVLDTIDSRMGSQRNPRTGQPLPTQSRLRPRFRAGKGVKVALGESAGG